MRKTIDLLALVAGVLAVAGGPLIALGLGFVAATDQGRESRLQMVTIALAVGVISVGCGAALIGAGAQAWRSLPDRTFWLPGWGWWLLAGLAALALGQAAGSSGLLSALPVLHIATGVTSAFFFLALALSAARSMASGVGARPAIGSIAWGALGGAGLAVVLELLLVVVLVILVAVWLGAAQPDLLNQLQNWVLQQMQYPGQSFDTEALRPWFSSPLVVLGMVLVLGLAVPLIEEATKSLAVPLVALTLHRPGLPLRRLTELEGFLFGVASGSGFALLEGILNGSVALATPRSWGQIMLARVGTAAIHCLATGLGGLAWQSALAKRPFKRVLGLGLAAVAVHGIWNVGAGMLALLGLTQQPGTAIAFAQILIVGLLILWWLAVVAALPLIAARLASSATLVTGPPSESPGPGGDPLSLVGSTLPGGDDQAGATHPTPKALS